MIALCLAGLIAAQNLAATDARADTGERAGHGDCDRFPEFWPRILSWFATYLD